MPEIVIKGLRDIGNGPSEASHEKLREMRQSHKVQLWSDKGTSEECEASWRSFLLQDMPDGIIWS